MEIEVGELYENNAPYEVNLWAIRACAVVRKIKKNEEVLLVHYGEPKQMIIVLTQDGSLGELLPGHFLLFKRK